MVYIGHSNLWSSCFRLHFKVQVKFKYFKFKFIRIHIFNCWHRPPSVGNALGKQVVQYANDPQLCKRPGTELLPLKHWVFSLALLDCVSRANAVAPASVVVVVVRKTETIKRINANFGGQVAVHHISRPLFSFSLTWDPMGVKISKRYSSTVTILFQPNFFYLFPVTVLTKLTYRNFEISNLKFS